MFDTKPITEAISRKFWYGGRAIFPWEHPVNKVKDAVMVHLDGVPAYKFKLHKNGRLRLMKNYKISSYLEGCFKLPIRPLQTVTPKRLVGMINRCKGKQLVANKV